MNPCTNQDFLSIIGLLKTILRILQIGIPIALLILASRFCGGVLILFSLNSL